MLGFFMGESVYAEGCGGGKETLSLLGFFPKLALGGDVLGWRTALSGERPLVRDGGGLKIMSCAEDTSCGEFSSEKTSKSSGRDDGGMLARSAEVVGMKKS